VFFTCEKAGKTFEIPLRFAGVSTIEGSRLQETEDCKNQANEEKQALIKIIEAADSVSLKSDNSEKKTLKFASWGRLAGHLRADGRSVIFELLKKQILWLDPRYKNNWPAKIPENSQIGYDGKCEAK